MRIAAAAILLLASSLAAADQTAPAFAVGILRRDGIIVPFATFDGRNWSARWPRPALDVTVPIDVRSVPSAWWGATGPLDNWEAWAQSGQAQPIRVAQPDWIDVHCLRQIGLRTDYRASEFPPPATEQPYPKDGLAISPPRPIEPIQSVAPAAGEAVALTAVLQEAFNEAERKTARKFEHPVKQAVRERMTPAIEAVYSHGGEPRVYYVESRREYTEMGTRECTKVSFGTGWFVREGGKYRPLSMVVDALNCDRLGASYMMPLGVVRVGSRVFWLVQFSGWDHERYVVIEPKARAVDAVISTFGGGC
jgi:hypothetical protein